MTMRGTLYSVASLAKEEMLPRNPNQPTEPRLLLDCGHSTRENSAGEGVGNHHMCCSCSAALEKLIYIYIFFRLALFTVQYIHYIR